MASVYSVPSDSLSPLRSEADAGSSGDAETKDSFGGFLGSDGMGADKRTSRSNAAGQFRGAFYGGRFHKCSNSDQDGIDAVQNPYWDTQRREIFSELRFDVNYFLSSTLFELFPTIISGPLVLCLKT